MKNSCLLSVLVLILMLPIQLQTQVLYVHPDSALNTIQAGLDAAGVGDTVLVAPGTYNESIVWPNRGAIQLISEFGPEETIITGETNLRVITMAQFIAQATLIDGFTITGGQAIGDTALGGAVYCPSASPTIRNNIIENNSGVGGGGGIACVNGSSPSIIANRIRNNGGGGGSGGGVHCNINSNPTIQENFFSNNSASAAGAVFCNQSSSPGIQYNQIIGNSGGGFGGALHVNEGVASACPRPTTNNNNIVGNTAWQIWDNNSVARCFAISATNNWWGQSDGPNAGGAQDVTGEVNFTPWLTEEIKFDIGIDTLLGVPDTVHAGDTHTPRILVRNNCNFNCPVSFFSAKMTIGDYKDYQRINQIVPKDSTIELTFANWIVPDNGILEATVEIFYAPEADEQKNNNVLTKPIDIPTSVEEKEASAEPSSFTLRQNYPNPFNPETTIEYSIKTAASVEIVIINELGQKVKTLVDEFLQPGNYVITWDGKGDSNTPLASGLYYYQIRTRDVISTKKAILLK